MFVTSLQAPIAHCTGVVVKQASLASPMRRTPSHGISGESVWRSAMRLQHVKQRRGKLVPGDCSVIED